MRKHVSRLGLLALLFAPGVCLTQAQANGAEFYEKKIRPLLSERCYDCHSVTGKDVKGGLRLDTAEGLMKGGENGKVITPGNPDASKLIQAVRHTAGDLVMPPKGGKLTDQQIADLVEWVRMGAPVPEAAPVAAAAPRQQADLTEARKAWQYQKPQDHPTPAVKNAAWVKSRVDAFILAKLEEKGLAPAAPADKRALIRRAAIDLTGLPPTTEEVEAFAADNSPEAFAKVIDRLLASPAYGERWARHWLDVVRYTDSFDARGIGGQADVAEAWRYRDWVVKAFNQDLPYDRFVTMQVAGDLLPSKAGADGKPNTDGLVATGVYVLGEWGIGDADKQKMLTDIVDDQIDVTGRAFLGLTLACARCHDHKFDPISAEDYYGLAGIFFSSHILPDPGARTAGSPILRVPLLTKEDQSKREADQARVAQLQKDIEAQLAGKFEALAKGVLPQLDQYLLASYDYNRRPAEQANVAIADYATQKKLDPYVLRQWVHLTAAGPLALLSAPIREVDGKPELKGLRVASGADTPNVVVNPTEQMVMFKTIRLPPRTLSVHPSPKAGITVGWKSPINGTVTVSGRLMDADPNCGNGVAWKLEQRTAAATVKLADGAFNNGASADVAAAPEAAEKLRMLKVEAGQILQLTVLPKEEYSCDSTVVELEIAEQAAAGRTWSLTRDVVPDLLGGGANPHADSLGNASVWYFYDAGDGMMAAGFGPDSILAAWFRATADAKPGEPAPSRARAEAAARSVKSTLVALDKAVDAMKAKGREVKTLTGSNIELYKSLTDPKGPFWAAARADPVNLPESLRAQVAGPMEELAKLKAELAQPIPTAHALQEGGTPASEYIGFKDAKVMLRGRYDRLGDVVPRRFPRIVAGDQQEPIKDGSGRLQLAKWVASAENPLTARVMANRIWMHHFGEGIVRTPNNYGKLGTPPTHPELLDHLAVQFVSSGWSVKQMHRYLMLSSAYQQSSVGDAATQKADPDNLLFGRMNRRRLEAEALRDSLLAVAGRLDRSMGGKAISELNTPRRSLYLMTIRSDRNNYRALFDAADPAAIVEKRNESTVAPQALFLMNHPFAIEQAKALADLALKQASADDRGRIDWLYRRLYARPPTAQEVDLALSVLGEVDKTKPDVVAAAWTQYCQILLCANEFMYVD
jgi:mono/diheme cytochrome c family protein